MRTLHPRCLIYPPRIGVAPPLKVDCLPRHRHPPPFLVLDAKSHLLLLLLCFLATSPSSSDCYRPSPFPPLPNAGDGGTETEDETAEADMASQPLSSSFLPLSFLFSLFRSHSSISFSVFFYQRPYFRFRSGTLVK